MALEKFSKDIYRGLPTKKLPGIGQEIKDMIFSYCNNRPRSLQTTLGPSSIGTECDRRLAFALSGIQGGSDTGNWLALIGTAVHAELLLGMMEQENEKLIQQGLPVDWLIEQKLDIHPPLVPTGSVDLFKISTGTVIDLKIVGKTTLDSVKSSGASIDYRVQAMTYGYGIAKLGYQVNDICIAYLPRNASPALPFLHEAEFYVEKFNLDMVVDALKRIDSLGARVDELNIAHNSKKLLLISPTAGKSCYFCPLKNNSKLCPDAKV